MKDGEASGQLACADVSLWEIAMLIAKDRVKVDEDPAAFIQMILDSRNCRVLPITPTIASHSTRRDIPLKDPADRLIAATAVAFGAELVSADAAMKKVPGLKLTW